MKNIVAYLAITVFTALCIVSCEKDPLPPKPNFVDLSEDTKQSITVNGVTFDMVYVQGGTFTMGCSGEQGSDCESDESPSHPVTLSDYYIGKFEVTQALWRAVMGSNPSYMQGNNLPVERVSWNDCQTFVNQLNSLTGRRFSLPTEAQWEYAARGGGSSRGYKYAGSNIVENVAWYTGSSDTRSHEVGGKHPNELGIYDMSGNVWEWCSDWYGAYGSSAQSDPTGPTSGTYRVVRGGNWDGDATYCRVSYRGIAPPDNSGNLGGLRLALDQPSSEVSIQDYIAISDGIYYYFSPSANVKTYYWSHYKDNDLPSGDNAIVSDLKANGVAMNMEDDHKGYSYSLSENTKYTVCVVSFDANGRRGALTKVVITTKSSLNQPLAAVTVHSVSGSTITYSIIKNSYCSSYVCNGYLNLTTDDLALPNIYWASKCYDDYKQSKNIDTQNDVNLTWSGWSNSCMIFTLGFSSSGVNGGVISRRNFNTNSAQSMMVQAQAVLPGNTQEGRAKAPKATLITNKNKRAK